MAQVYHTNLYNIRTFTEFTTSFPSYHQNSSTTHIPPAYSGSSIGITVLGCVHTSFLHHLPTSPHSAVSFPWPHGILSYHWNHSSLNLNAPASVNDEVTLHFIDVTDFHSIHIISLRTRFSCKIEVCPRWWREARVMRHHVVRSLIRIKLIMNIVNLHPCNVLFNFFRPVWILWNLSNRSKRCRVWFTTAKTFEREWACVLMWKHHSCA